jgi:hypothetical protein
MKKLIACCLSVGTLSLLSGCATAWPSNETGGVNGAIYKNYSGPLWVSPTATGSKKGSASATSIMGIVGVGDASIKAAAANGGITKINHVDQTVKSILGLWAKYTVTVYGD